MFASLYYYAIFRIKNCKEGKKLSLEKEFSGHSGKVIISRKIYALVKFTILAQKLQNTMTLMSMYYDSSLHCAWSKKNYLHILIGKIWPHIFKWCANIQKCRYLTIESPVSKTRWHRKSKNQQICLVAKEP